MDNTLKKKFSGSLIGQCLGDALGCPVEGYPPAVCRRYVSEILKSGTAEEFGQYTDDSQLARELIQSYVACGQFDPRDYAGRIATIFNEQRIIGHGRATEEAAFRLIHGIPWERSGTPSPSAGNGSAMRAAPIGLMFFDEPDQLIQAACDQGRITHQDPRCSAGAVAIAGAVSLALRMNPLRIKDFLLTIGILCREVEQTLASYILDLNEWVFLPPEEAVLKIATAGLSTGHSYQGISPFVIGSVLWSLYSFLKTHDDYWETVCTAIAAGGDVDTTAAMAGAISGAYLGLDAIPLQYARCLTDNGTWGYKELVDLSQSCYDIKMKKIRQ